jgi:hypothetical protein
VNEKQIRIGVCELAVKQNEMHDAEGVEKQSAMGDVCEAVESESER